MLPANYAFVAADQGRHTFSVTLNSVGTESITATDIHHSTIHGTIAFNVQPTVPSDVVFGAPSFGLFDPTVVDALFSSDPQHYRSMAWWGY